MCFVRFVVWRLLNSVIGLGVIYDGLNALHGALDFNYETQEERSFSTRRTQAVVRSDSD